MMKGLVREYGLIVIIIILCMVGYWLFRENKGGILDYSLDVIGERLIAMVDDEASKQLIADRFFRFKDRVMAREVAPEEVEHVVANVLNLSNSGATLTAEQAELMLQFASVEPEETLLPVPDLSETAGGIEPAPSDSIEAPDLSSTLAAVTPEPPAPSDAPEPLEPVEIEDLNALGDRLESMLSLNEVIQEAIEERAAQRQELVQHIRFRFDNGLHIDIDAGMSDEMKRVEFKRLAEEVQKLEEKRMVVWRKNMGDEWRAERERVRHELRSVVALRGRQPRLARRTMERIKYLEALKHLEEMGYRPMLSDSLREVFEEQFEAAMERWEEALDAQLEEIEEAAKEEAEGQQN
ncbi:MAG: hypothetical protein ACE5G0_00165 [Rhodothermales bacterium]